MIKKLVSFVWACVLFDLIYSDNCHYVSLLLSDARIDEKCKYTSQLQYLY